MEGRLLLPSWRESRPCLPAWPWGSLRQGRTDGRYTRLYSNRRSSSNNATSFKKRMVANKRAAEFGMMNHVSVHEPVHNRSLLALLHFLEKGLALLWYRASNSSEKVGSSRASKSPACRYMRARRACSFFSSARHR